MVVSLLWFTRLFSESTEMAELLRLSASATTVMFLNTGDKVSVVADTSNMYIAPGYSYFTGFLYG